MTPVEFPIPLRSLAFGAELSDGTSPKVRKNHGGLTEIPSIGIAHIAANYVLERCTRRKRVRRHIEFSHIRSSNVQDLVRAVLTPRRPGSLSQETAIRGNLCPQEAPWDDL